MISSTSMSLLTISTVLTILIPIVIAVVWLLASKSRIYPLFIGSIIFFIFVLILESSMHSVFLGTFPFVNDNLVLYVLYGCLAAGFFEEGGRFVAFKFLIKNSDKKSAVTYGIGHGGIEMILVVGLTLLSTLLFAYSYNTLGLEGMMAGSSDATLEAMIIDTIASIEAYTVSDAILSLVERLIAIVIHISCSVLVFACVHKNNYDYLGYSFGLHALANVPAALYQRGVISNLVIVEGMILIVAIVCAVFAYQTYKKMD